LFFQFFFVWLQVRVMLYSRGKSFLWRSLLPLGEPTGCSLPPGFRSFSPFGRRSDLEIFSGTKKKCVEVGLLLLACRRFPHLRPPDFLLPSFRSCPIPPLRTLPLQGIPLPRPFLFCRLSVSPSFVARSIRSFLCFSPELGAVATIFSLDPFFSKFSPPSVTF